MSDARLTVKVRIQSPSLAELPESQPAVAPLSRWRIVGALCALLAVSYGGYRLWQKSVSSPVDTAEQQLVAEEGAESTESDLVASSITATPADVQHAQPVVSQPNVSADSALPVAEQPPANQALPTTPSTTAVAADHQGVVASSPSAALPAGFSRIVLTAQMESLQPGATLGPQIPFASVKRLYLFTEVKGYAGQVLTHRWYYKNQLHTEAKLTIEDSPWRTYSENWLLDDQVGDWHVEIVDQAQNLLYRYDFHYQ